MRRARYRAGCAIRARHSRSPRPSPANRARALRFSCRAAGSSAATIAVPTLLVREPQSDLLSEEGPSLLELNTHARYVDVAGAGHMAAGGRNDVFAAAVTDFLSDLDRA